MFWIIVPSLADSFLSRVLRYKTIFINKSHCHLNLAYMREVYFSPSVESYITLPAGDDLNKGISFVETVGSQKAIPKECRTGSNTILQV